MLLRPCRSHIKKFLFFASKQILRPPTQEHHTDAAVRPPSLPSQPKRIFNYGIKLILKSASCKNSIVLSF